MKKTQSQSPEDPVVQEVREIRRKLWDEAGHDIKTYIEQTRREVSKRGRSRRRKTG